MREGTKRLFFGCEVHAPWPEKMPKGRLLDPEHRHLTLAFLGNTDFISFQKIILEIPKPLRTYGVSGYFDACLKLSHVVAWRMKIFNKFNYHDKLNHWLSQKGYQLEKREWLPHVTLCRAPFNFEAWSKDFIPLPFYTSSIHLYESVGNLRYIPVLTFPIEPPFEEFPHTADMAFKIKGNDIQDYYYNAFTALCFKAPELVPHLIPKFDFDNLDDVIIGLNQIISAADQAIGCPFKAVSFHGVIKDNSWEMIVDV